MTGKQNGDLPKSRRWEIPDYSEQVFADRRTRFAIVIPVINEGERIQAQLREMSEAGHMDLADTVIVDGGSTDGSLDVLTLGRCGIRALLTKTGPGKLSAQLRCAYAWVLDQGYEGIVTIDGNGKDGIETVPAFVNALGEGYDYIQASRFIAGGSAENTPLSRSAAIRLIHAPVLSLAAGHRFTDTTQGFRAYSRRYLLDDQVQPFRSIFDRYELLAYLTVRASQLGYRVKELPTRRDYPESGVVPTKIDGLRGQFDLLVTMFKAAIGAFHSSSGKKGRHH